MNIQADVMGILNIQKRRHGYFEYAWSDVMCNLNIHKYFEYSQSAVMGILKPGVMGILNIHSDIGILNILEVTSLLWIFKKRRNFEWILKIMSLWIFKIPMASASVFKIPMSSPHKYSKCPWNQLLNIQNTHEVISWIFTLDVSFWTFKMPMTSLHEYSKYPWLSFMDIQNNPWRHLLNIQNTHEVTSWIFKYAWFYFNI